MNSSCGSRGAEIQITTAISRRTDAEIAAVN